MKLLKEPQKAEEAALAAEDAAELSKQKDQ